MNVLMNIGEALKSLVGVLINFFWGDIVKIPLAGGKSLDVSFLVLLLALSGIYFTFRTRFLQFRMIPNMARVLVEKDGNGTKGFSRIQTLIVATATRVGMGNLAGVVAAISIGGAGSIFWMWIFAILGSSLAFVESVLAQLHKRKNKTTGDSFGGPAYYIHDALIKPNSKRKKSIIAVLFAISGIICWCGISQVASSATTGAVKNTFSVPPYVTSLILAAVAIIILFKKNMTVKMLDILVPIMAGSYFLMTLFVIVKNVTNVPDVFAKILSEAFGFRQLAAGGIGAVIVTGAKRGIFSNEAGSGSVPNVVALTSFNHPAKAGLLQCFGVFIDTVISTFTAFLILFVPNNMAVGAKGMDLLQSAMDYHVGSFGPIFITIILVLFSFSTFLGITIYAKPNVTYIFGEKSKYQILCKVLFIVMLFLGGLNAYTFVWDLADLGIGLMTIFNMLALFLLTREAVDSLKNYEKTANNLHIKCTE